MRYIKQVVSTQVDISALQEMRLKESDRIDQNNFTILYSGGEKQGYKGLTVASSGAMYSVVHRTW